ncbi:MAG: ABC transporter substrate-binding protein [Desulfobacteraceae bacterium]|nr:ABC transporter substrate-binding protein [Desulfobacteraceae bacterium]
MKKYAGIMLTSITFTILSLVPLWAAENISDGVVKIGIMTDISGTYAEFGGMYSVHAAKMAVEDFGGKVLNRPIELIFEDHRNKPHIASNTAMKWFNADKVDVIAGLTSSGCALATAKVAKDMNRITLVSGAASTKLTNENCSPNNVHWTFDTYSNSVGTAKSVLQIGGDSWFIITADYAFGLSMEQDTIEVLKANGGKVLGTVRHPLASLDFAPYLIQAKASGAKIIGLANAGADTINIVKQAGRMGITNDQSLVGLVMTLSEIHSLGLETAQGMMFTVAWYWDCDDDSRAWAKRFFENQKRMPNMVHAGVYSSVSHYLKAVKEAGTDRAEAVMATMKKLPVNDMFAKNGTIRYDGRMIHNMFMVQVKKPSESKAPWDYFLIRKVIPASEAFQPPGKSRCYLEHN